MSQNYVSSALHHGDEIESTAFKRRKSSKHENVSGSDTKVKCTSQRESTYWKGKVKINHFPTEVLKKILQNLSYHEISKVREVCRSFRDVCDEILNHAFCQLNDRLQQHFKLLEAMETGEHGPKNCRKCEKRRCVWLLTVIHSKVCLLRAVCYRFLCMNDNAKKTCHPRSFFAGKIIDEVHGILRLISLHKIEDGFDASLFMKHVDTFIDFFHYRIEPTFVGSEAVINRSTLFGSKVIDLLDCVLDCDKKVNVREDAQGWCHVTGEYKFHNSFLTCLSGKCLKFQDAVPLTAKEQRILHDCLYSLISKRNEWALKEKQRKFRNSQSGIEEEFSYPTGCYQGLANCDNSVYFFGYSCCLLDYLTSDKTLWNHDETYDTDDDDYDDVASDGEENYDEDDEDDEEEDDEEEDEDEEDEDNENDDKNDTEDEEDDKSTNSDEEGGDIFSDRREPGVTVTVALRCRKELAPLEVLLKRRNNSSIARCKSKSTKKDSDHDLVLRLEIISPVAAMYKNRLPPVYRCLIKQKYLVEEPAPKPEAPGDAASPSDINYKRSDIFTISDSIRAEDSNTDSSWLCYPSFCC